jgi:hypothetical protein
MPYSATVFRVLIASPSDVPREREAIAQTLNDWNSLNSKETGKVLMPVMWETHSAPAMGDDPQTIINNQVVRGCDMLIGAFWTRLGSPTGRETSGTVEEIKFFLEETKPVMLYYSMAQVAIGQIDTDQLNKLNEFKQSIRLKGLQAEYNSIDELKQRLSRHLTIVMREISVGTRVDNQAVKQASIDENNDVISSEIENNPENISFINYTERAFIIKRNTAKFKEALSSAGGKWISLRTGGKGWMFSKKHLQKISKLLNVSPELQPC